MKSSNVFILVVVICLFFVIGVYIFIKRDWTPMLLEDAEYKKMLRYWEEQVEYFAEFCSEEEHVGLLYDQALDVRTVTYTPLPQGQAEHRVFLIQWSQLAIRFEDWPPLFINQDLDFYLTCSTVKAPEIEARRIVYYSVHVNAGFPSDPLSKPPYELQVNEEGFYQGVGYEKHFYHPSNGLRSEGILYRDSYQIGWRKSPPSPAGRTSK